MKNSILQQMKANAKEYKDMSINDMKALINRGHEIKKSDQEALDNDGILKSHYHLPKSDKDALGAASLYDIYDGGDSFVNQFSDKEE